MARGCVPSDGCVVFTAFLVFFAAAAVWYIALSIGSLDAPENAFVRTRGSRMLGALGKLRRRANEANATAEAAAADVTRASILLSEASAATGGMQRRSAGAASSSSPFESALAAAAAAAATLSYKSAVVK